MYGESLIRDQQPVKIYALYSLNSMVRMAVHYGDGAVYLLEQ